MRYLALALLVAALAGCAGQGQGRAGAGGAPALAPGGGDLPHTAGCATHTSPPAMSIEGTPQPANQNALDAVADRIEPYAIEHCFEFMSDLTDVFQFEGNG